MNDTNKEMIDQQNENKIVAPVDESINQKSNDEQELAKDIAKEEDLADKSPENSSDENIVKEETSETDTDIDQENDEVIDADEIDVKVEEKPDNTVNIRMKKSSFRILSVLFAILAMVAVGIAIYGVKTTAEIMHLRKQVKVQDQQLKLLDTKTKKLENKMKEVNALDQELRHIISGTNRGVLPQGGGTIDDLTKKDEPRNTGKKPVDLLARIYRLDGEARRHIISFHTLQAMLEAGGTEKIEQLQEYLLPIDGSQDHAPNIWPAKGVLTSPFGTRVDPITGRTAYHQGVDIANAYGTPIIATADGVVTSVDYQGGYGLMVEIDNGNGYSTRFAHNSSALVKVGEKVKRGQPIALMGSTGRSTGCHVHYEVLINGANVDPMLFLRVK